MARRLSRLPGHREGIRKHQRYGQLALTVGPTLAARLEEIPESERCPNCGQPDNCGDCNCNPIPVDRLVTLLRPTCVVCGGPNAEGNGCEFCPKV